jgi:nicotinic acid mononucleotide adenylyltransferase
MLLEKKLQEGSSWLAQKKICFYPGAFDPIHRGHRSIVSLILEKQCCDFVLIYPSWGWGGKQLTNVHRRLAMLEAVFGDHERVLVTHLPPIALQHALTVEVGPGPRKPIEGIEFLAMVGSDNATKDWSDHDAIPFMEGHPLPLHYHKHTIGGIMALPVTGFVVALRNRGDLPAAWPSTIQGRPVIATVHDPESQWISSSLVRECLERSLPIDHLVDPVVESMLTTSYQVPLLS